jgi:hypothetical protein
MKSFMFSGQRFAFFDTQMMQITDDMMVCFILYSECKGDGDIPVHYRMGPDNVSPNANLIPRETFFGGFADSRDLATFKSKIGM